VFFFSQFKELNPELRMRAVVFHGALTALTPVLPNFSSFRTKALQIHNPLAHITIDIVVHCQVENY
jgi:hypothetical protein